MGGNALPARTETPRESYCSVCRARKSRDVRARPHYCRLAQRRRGIIQSDLGFCGYSALSSRNLAKARDRAEELVTLGRHSTDSDLLLEAFHCRWSTALFRGDTATALTDSREGIDRMIRTSTAGMGPVFGGHDPGVAPTGFMDSAFPSPVFWNKATVALIRRFPSPKRSNTRIASRTLSVMRQSSISSSTTTKPSFN